MAVRTIFMPDQEQLQEKVGSHVGRLSASSRGRNCFYGSAIEFLGSTGFTGHLQDRRSAPRQPLVLSV